MNNELECKTLKAARPVLVCLGKNLVYSVFRKLLGGKIFFFFFLIYSECGSILKSVPGMSKTLRFASWETVEWPRVQHHLPRPGSPLTSPVLLHSANLSLLSPKTNCPFCIPSPLHWDRFPLRQTSFRFVTSGNDPTCSVTCTSKQVPWVESGPNATAVVSLETIYSLKWYSASTYLSPWSVVAGVAGCRWCDPQMWEVAAVLERYACLLKGPAIFVCCYILFCIVSIYLRYALI